MTLPGEPKIKINPSEAERHCPGEWLEISEFDDGHDQVQIVYVRWAVRDLGPLARGKLILNRRDACTLADHIGAYLWKPGDEKDTANRADDGEPDPSSSTTTQGRA